MNKAIFLRESENGFVMTFETIKAMPKCFESVLFIPISNNKVDETRETYLATCRNVDGKAKEIEVYADKDELHGLFQMRFLTIENKHFADAMIWFN